MRQFDAGDAVVRQSPWRRGEGPQWVTGVVKLYGSATALQSGALDRGCTCTMEVIESVFGNGWAVSAWPSDANDCPLHPYAGDNGVNA